MSTLKKCSKNHPNIFFQVNNCPLCATRAAGISILQEYFNVRHMCQRLLKHLAKAGRVHA